MVAVPEMSSRDKLLLAAQRLFFSKGYDNSSVNEIIAAVGVSKGAFYHYFESKQDILEALVADLTAQLAQNMAGILADESLAVLDKWQKLVAASNEWKLERKTELLQLARVLMSDDNVLLRYKLREARKEVLVGTVGQIVAQGVAEGVFMTPLVAEAAEMVVALHMAFGESVNEILINQAAYNEPAQLVKRKLEAVQMGMERILAAPAGSMPLVADEASLLAWFDE
ncbi:MAG TPA: TetR/AcrR family transcriptional regulator [Anaerolineae bacterium]|nr:TetR/AcrR family transcriptional regulator [Anaerolineae bacterium]